MAEWNHNKRWNPFNSYKLLAHVEHWSNIRRGNSYTPPPILVTIDPTNACNLNCEWCNAKYIRDKNKLSLSEHAMMRIADFLPNWSDVGDGVKAVCIAGGGEPLLNPGVGKLIDALVGNGIEVGVVTNGLLIDKFLPSLSKCTWVGVSIDAGTDDTYKRYKGEGFYKVIENIRALVDYSKDSTLGSDKPSYGVSYKYLLYKDNMYEVAEAARIAKDIGCKNIHYRPAGTSWDKIESNDNIVFSDNDIAWFKSQIDKAMEFDSPEFGVYGVTHKFNSQFKKSNHFSKCYAVFMTAVIEPPTEPGDGFTVGVCCDRRGDEKVELLHNSNRTFDIRTAWGSEEHWRIHDEIKVGECPRCTYQPHNEIYEQVILKDSMTHKFI